jgi:DNA-binding CsgD family transcriptional regulator
MVGGMSTTGACQSGGFPIGGITVADDDHTLSPLRGRESELHRITDLFHRAGRGHRSVLVIEGPSGSGRTRLLGELVSAARQTRCLVFEQNGSVPFMAVRQLARECERLAARLAAPPGSVAAGPVLVAWDDPHWTGPGWSGRDVLPSFAAARSAPILWALTRRTGEGRDAARILDGPAVFDVELRPLSTAAVGEVLADLLGAPASMDLVCLAAAASGNPRALVDLVDGLRDEGLVDVHAGRARLTSIRLPERFSSRVRGQMARLSAPAKRLVQVAAAVGPSRVPELARLLGQTTAGLLPTIEEALSSGLLVCDDELLAFSHELVRGIVAAALPRSVRSALRDEVGRVRATAQPVSAQTTDWPAARLTTRRTTGAPVAASPTTASPTTASPTTALPTTALPTTALPTTALPTTALPAPVRTPARTAPRGPDPSGPDPSGPDPRGPADGWEGFSDTERTIARLVSQAFTNRQIATRVHLSPHTVNYHLRQIYRKLKINSRVQLAHLAQARLAEPCAASSAS